MVAVRFETGGQEPVSRSVIPFPLEHQAVLLKKQFQVGIEELLKYNSHLIIDYRVGEELIKEDLPQSFLTGLAKYGFRPLAAGPVTVNYSLVPHREREICAISIGDQEGHKIGLIVDGDKPTVRETEDGNPARYPEMRSARLRTSQQKLEFGLSLVEMAKALMS